MDLRLTVSAPGTPSADVLVDVDPASPVADLAAQLGSHLGAGHAERWRLYLGGLELDPAGPVHSSPIRDGSQLSLGGPAHPDLEPQGIVEVRVAGGPGAGRVWRLGPGSVTIGGSSSDRIQLGDPSLPAAAATLDVAGDGTCTLRLGPEQTATLESDPIPGTVTWAPLHLLALGRCLLEIATPDFPDASLHPSEDGAGLDYSRPPRLAPPERPTQFSLPTPPRPNEPRPMPWVMAIVPLIAALVMAKLFDNLMFLAFAFLSPISLMANHFSDRRHGKKTHRATMAEYAQRRAAIVADAEAALGAEQAQRRHDCPDPAVIGLIATGPRQRLWERRRRDEDRLLLRVGTGTLPSEVILSDPDREEHQRHEPLRLHNVPVTVSLTKHGVLGIAGRTEEARALGRWLVAQCATLHSPSDLSICVLTEPMGAASWRWAGWLPHARPREGQQTIALLGTTTDTTGRRISELLAQLSAREAALRAAGSGATIDAPDILVVLDGSRRLRALPGVAQILADGPRVGIRSICLDTEARLLPEECQAVVTLEDRGMAKVRQAGADTVDQVRPDQVDVAWCDRLGRALAPIRDVSRDDDAALPGACRLLDVLGLEPPNADRIAAGWTVDGRSTKAVVGVSLDGPFAIDLVTDGPHGLVAGTTGSGKSELLQSLVASLAVANRPDAMTFILVDYKGGSAFGECAKLPHTVGMVTDLDTHLVGRALDSLGAELRRREHLFAAAGVPGLPEYEAARRRDPSLASLPRLLIVIDEFASLARELPEFVSGLVNVAQRGRSLGIHLVLATQRPSGVVSPEIRANTNLRIALRVTDTAESTDIIDAPDAARIAKSTPGRAYARLGHNSLLPFQAGRIGGRRAGPVASATTPEPFVTVLLPDALGLPSPARPRTNTSDPEIPVTDLSVLVDAIRNANAALGIPAQPSPWLPALTDAVNLDDLLRPDASTDAAATLRPAPFAVVDLPAEQRREVWSVDLDRFGHLFVAGAPRTGRSQALRTLAGSLARENSSADVHMFGLDCGNGALLPLRSLPHCGAVVRSSETERAKRLLDRLLTELRARMALLGERHVTDISEQRATAAEDDRLPHLVVLIDRWEGFLASLGEQDGGALTDLVMQLAREGASAGIHLIVSGDHTLLGGRIGALTDSKLVLRLADKADFSLIGIAGRQVPDAMPPGRGYRALGGQQVQVALLDPDPAGAAQAAALERIGAGARERDGEVAILRRPFGVDVLPSRITLDEAWGLRVAEPGPLAGVVAVGGDRLTAYGPDLATGTPAFVIAGPPRSGRSTALRALAASYLRIGTRVLLVAPRSSPLRNPFPGVGPVGLLTGPDLAGEDLKEVLLDRGPLVILIDDAELLRECSAGPELSAIVRRQLGENVGLVLAGDADSICAGFSGWQVEARKARRGLLLSPQNMTDADLIGIRLQRTAIGNPVQPGRGILHLGNGEPLVVQVPLPSFSA